METREQNKENRVSVLTPEVLKIAKERGLHLYYIKVACEKCGKSYGISLDDLANVGVEKFRCFKCAAQELDKLLEKS